MNISTDIADNSSAGLSGEVMDRMHGTPSSYNAAPDMGQRKGLVDLKEATNLISKQNGELEKASGVYSKPVIEIKKPTVDKPCTVDKAEVTKPSAPAKALQELSEGKPVAKKKRARKKWKKPKDKPNRPLSAYNLFFQSERASMLGDQTPQEQTEKGKRLHRKTHGKVGFAEMARVIGARWKNLPEEGKKGFVEEAAKLKERYAVELAAWKEEQKAKYKAKKASRKKSARQEEEAADKASAAPQEEGGSAHSRRQMMTDGVNRRNLSMFQQPRTHQQDLPTIEYLQALQDRQVERAAFMGRPNRDFGPYEYPSAAEASANAILQQFQSMPYGPRSQLFDSSARLPRYPAGMAADFPPMGPSQFAQMGGADFPPMGLSQFAQMGGADFPPMGPSQFAQMGGADFPPMGPSQFAQMGGGPTQRTSFDLSGSSASRDFDRLQRLRMQTAMDLSQGAGPPLPGSSQYGNPSGGDLDQIQVSQYPGSRASMAAAMRRFRYGMY